jgi:cell division protein FtsB
MPIPKPMEPWMRIVEQENKYTVSSEDLLELLQTKREEGTPLQERKRPFLSGFPSATTALGIMIVALGIMVIILKSDIGVLKDDITDLKNLKAQVATLDPTTQVKTLESRLGDMKKEKDVIREEMAQLQADLETIKTEPKKEKNKTPNRVRHRPTSTHTKVRKAMNEEVLLKKASPQGMLFSDFSRATSLDPPPK